MSKLSKCTRISRPTHFTADIAEQSRVPRRRKRSDQDHTTQLVRFWSTELLSSAISFTWATYTFKK